MKSPSLKFLLALAWLSGPLHAHNTQKQPSDILHWHAPEIATVSNRNFDFHSGNLLVSWRAPGQVKKIDGKDCLVGGYFFFDVRDDFALDIDETVRVEVEVDTRVTDGFHFSYDHAVNPVVRAIAVTPDSAQPMKTVSFEIDRARFANRKYEYTDIAIGALGATEPQDRTKNGEVAICGFRLFREAKVPKPEVPTVKGKLTLSVSDVDGTESSARIGLFREDGSSPLPDESALLLTPFENSVRQWSLLSTPRGWPSAGRYVSFVKGSYQADLDPGTYTLVISKGPEYRLTTATIEILPGQTTRQAIRLKRWTNMPSKGWYSADGHIHIARPTQDMNEDVLAYMSAEDLHLSNLLQVSTPATYASYPQYAFGKDGHYDVGNYALASGQESPRSSHRGHTIGLNAPKYVWNNEGYFVYDRVGREISELGGMFGYAHVAIDAFNVRYGLATDVPLGNVSFLEILQLSQLDTGHFYNLLNLGYRLLPSAGSDFPFIETFGADRMYAQIGATKFSPHSWFDAYRKGRSFVTSGPIIDFTVDGDGKQSEYAVARGAPLRVKANASVNPDFDLLDRIELVVAGEVVASAKAKGGTSALAIDHTLTPDHSTWAAVRTFGTDGTVAHTAPFYIIVDGERRTWQRDQVTRIANTYIAILDEFRASAPNPDEDWERAETEGVSGSAWDRDKTALDKSIAEARSRYLDLIKAATASK